MSDPLPTASAGGRADGRRSGSQPVFPLRLYTPDEALRRAWADAVPPDGFRLETLETLTSNVLDSEEPSLGLIDAGEAAAATGDLAQALDAEVHRCIWTGTAEAIGQLADSRLSGAYDFVVTPVTAETLTNRLARWADRIERTAAIDRLGRRVDALAEENSRLSQQLGEAQRSADELAGQRSRLDRAVQRIQEVARLSRQISSLDLDAIVDVVVHRVPDLIDARRASLYLYDPASDRLVLAGRSGGHAIAERIDLSANPNSAMAFAVRQGKALLIGQPADLEHGPPPVLDRPFEDTYETGSCIVAPLKGSGRVLGVLNLADKRDGAAFTAEIDLPIIEQIAELLATSIYNVELYREMEHRAKTDPLTGLANRRALEEALTREVDRARRYGSALAVIMIDVDDLKDVNDRRGHPAGDAVLQNLAAILLEAVRSVDVPGRWAGDEFLVILPDTDASQAEQLARRLRTRGHEQPAALDGESVATTVSIGVTQYVQDETPESLIRRVDAALYRAKATGRDRIATA